MQSPKKYISENKKNIFEIVIRGIYCENVGATNISDLCDMGSFIKKKITMQNLNYIDGLIWISSISDGICLHFSKNDTQNEIIKIIESAPIIKEIKKIYKNTNIKLTITKRKPIQI